MKIEAGEHLLLVGKTGSGKSFLAQKLLSNVQHCIIIDPKGTGARKFNYLPPTKKNIKKYLNHEPIRIGVKPIVGTLDDNYSRYEEFYQMAFETHNTLIYSDELYLTTKPKAGAFLTACYTAGREFKVSAWGCSQRPVLIPPFCISEVTHCFVFRLGKKDDRKRMSEHIGDDALKPIIDRYGFWYMNVAEGEKPIYYKQVK